MSDENRPSPPGEVLGGPETARLRAPRAILPDGFVDALVDVLGAESVSVDEESCLRQGRDWWPISAVWATRQEVPARAEVVVRIRSAEEAAVAVALAGSGGVPVTVAAGRSGVCGGALPVAGGLVLDTTGLDRVFELDEESLRLRVGAGMFGDVLEARLRHLGYTLGHSPQSIALSTVGGWLACRSAGQFSTRYGKIEDMVAALAVVTAEGRELRTGGAPRAATGPDLAGLFLGSEGTLGVITEATLRVHPAPATEARAAFRFPTFAAGLDACRRTLRRGVTPAVLRLYDEIESARSLGESGHVMVVLDEGDPVVVAGAIEVTRAEFQATEGVEELGEAPVERWMEHRYDVSGLGRAVQMGLVVDTIEVAAPWRALSGLYQSVRSALASVPGALVASGHCSHSYLDGACLYFTFAGGVGDEAKDRAAAQDDYYRTSFRVAMEATIAGGGAISHHHGIGLVRAPFMRRALGEPAFEVLVALKRALDPKGILNPGKLGLPSPFLPSGWEWE
ncbi:MAG: FAD-binding oxidoreductase [Acidimicrobiia bacterium]